MRRSILAVSLLLSATAPARAAESGGLNTAAIGMFVGIVLVTLGITYWAARRAHSSGASSAKSQSDKSIRSGKPRRVRPS